ncbi:MAG: cellulase family glycosylhydrolase [Flavobacterium sp.]|uniref:cellulase family glycosylhydrolase n=1 Tax=Flavobacterium sp. TaxID=239 RepID=UPI002636EBDF|nr:cellulase family glycosylhydrolase [Flavobacterium sp.]MDD5151217.1 cellulase family glycosylhydrolase [Flavobacterium sp.]
MKTFSTFILVVVISCSIYSQSKKENGLTFLHTSGQDMVNQSGEKVYLKGVGLGNWLLPEGYMWKFGGLGDRPRKIEKVVEDLIGKEKANHFWKIYRQNYITESDIQRIAELGFNSVRPALNSRLFLTEGENSVYLEEGFQLIDSLVSWCKKHKIYVIIDMHGAPGGQTGANIDDSANDIPELFTDKKYEEQLVNLWVKIAERYKDEPVIAAYDLLNEPLPIGTGAADKYKHLLIPVYKHITSEIRKVDQKHMITLEGFNWANDWSLFDKPFDSNVFYQFHYYCWARPDNLNDINGYLIKRKELNTPIWVGETGEKGNAIYWATTQYFDANNIGFSFWPWKKMDTKNTPYSIKKPDNWDLISEYTKEGSKPDSVVAEKAFNDLLENIKIANCDYFEDVCNAINTRIPGKIEAENYGFEGYNRSYFVLDTLNKSKFYRTNEPVQIKLDSTDKDQFWSEQSIELQKSEWVVYNFKCLDNKKHLLTIRASVNDLPAYLEIWINNKKVNLTVTNKDFSELTIGVFKLKKGENKIKIQVKSNGLKLDWFKFN